MEQWILKNNFIGKMPYSISKVLPVVIDEVEVGTPMVRPRSTKSQTYHNFSFVFSRDEWDLINNWVQFNLANATQPFLFPDPVKQDWDNKVPFRFALEKMENNWYSNMSWNQRYIKVDLILEEI